LDVFEKVNTSLWLVKKIFWLGLFVWLLSFFTIEHQKGAGEKSDQDYLNKARMVCSNSRLILFLFTVD